MKSLSEKLVRNTAFYIVTHVWMLFIGIILTPYIIGRIGLVNYGVWVMIGIVTGYIGMLDFGVSNSFTKYIAEHYTKKEYGKINQIVSIGLVFYLIFSLLIIVSALLLMHTLFNFLRIPRDLSGEAVFVFILGVVMFGVSNLMGVFTSIQIGLQRLDIASRIGIALSIPMVIGTVFFLESGWGLRGLIINNAIVLAINIAVNIIVALKIFPQLKINLLSFNKEMFAKLFSYGFKTQVTRLERGFSFQADKLLISHFLNIQLVGLYQLGSTVVDKARQLALLIVSAVVPAASELEAKNSKDEIINLYFRATKYIAIFGIPVLVLIFLKASLIMLVWMGCGYERSVVIIRILAPCYILSILTGGGSTVALGIGRPEFNMKASIFQLVFNIILSVILIIKIGFIGAAISAFVSISLSSAWFMKMFHAHLGYPLLRFIRKIILAPLIGSVLACAGALYLDFVINLFVAPSTGRLSNFYILLSESVVFMGIYIFLILQTDYIDENDRTLLLSKLPVINRASGRR